MLVLLGGASHLAVTYTLALATLKARCLLTRSNLILAALHLVLDLVSGVVRPHSRDLEAIRLGLRLAVSRAGQLSRHLLFERFFLKALSR